MEKIWKSLCTVIFIFTILIFYRPFVRAETIPYLITTGFTVQTTGYGNGQIFYQRFPQITYSGGKVMLSANADGTGTMHVEDMMQVIDSYASHPLTFYTFDNNCKVFNREIPATDITSLFSFGYNYITVRFSEWCPPIEKTVGPVYIVYFKPGPSVTPTPSPIPSPTPTPSPTPIPTPAPFLDLPWDYRSDNMSFNDAALSIESYFDHTYPLLSVASLPEPSDDASQVTTFRNEHGFPYSSHDGYDYAARAKVNYGDDVFAAADGVATYRGYNACGHVVAVDHQNGYQTKYCHLQPDGLITNEIGKKIAVKAGQSIGKVGFSGHVIPQGLQGAHLHFMVVEDKNKDGNFDDNVPDGLTDPFGWQSLGPDPWPSYSFFYLGKQRTGNSSYYLWKKKIDILAGDLLPEGGIFTTGKVSVSFPPGITANNSKIFIQAVPVAQPSASLRSMGSPYEISLKDQAGNPITELLKNFDITFDFTTLDLSRIKTETISIYSSQDGQNWTKENTAVDMINKSAKTSVNHLTQFALMAERKDSTAPITTVTFDGLSGESGWYRSDVAPSLSAVDNSDGLGVRYTLFRTDDGDWEEYKKPFTFTQEGHHKVEYFSADNDGNVEEIKSSEFDIDKTIPEAQIELDKAALEMKISGSANSGPTTFSQEELKKNKDRVMISDKAGNTLTLLINDREKGRQAKLSIESLQYNQESPVILDPNRFYIQYNLDETKEDLKKLTQVFEIKGEIKLKLEYGVKTNKTKIITKESGKEKVKEEVDSLTLLKLFTEKGTLKSSY